MKVVIDDVTKVFDHPRDASRKVVAVDRLSLTIAEGEMVTLLGPSGCGKTTTLRMVGGFETPTDGRILIDGRDVTYQPPNRRDTAMVFQSYAVFPHLDVRKNVSFGLELKKGLAEKELTNRVNRVLNLVGLKGLEDRSPDQLSGGQQQRVALARAIVNEPSVLLFDEPLSNLDAKLRESMRQEIRSLQQRLGITSLYVTHDQSEAMALSDRIVIMRDGIVEQVGTPTEVYTRPVNHFVADFIGRANFINARIAERTKTQDGENYRVQVGDHQLTVPVQGTEFEVDDFVDFLVRPENLFLRPWNGSKEIGASERSAWAGKAGPDSGHDDPAAQSMVAEPMVATIEKMTYLGATVEYTVELNGQRLVSIVSNPLVDGLYRVGDRVSIGFSTRVAHLLQRQ